ncbi:MAG: hypothetical protein K1X64_14410 [Myxococcaceae bacterium]|nr:hypothetical protein [Myxococcaceae bacterium]
MANLRAALFTGRHLALTASIFVCALHLAGCAMSQQAYGKHAAELSDRNGQRYRAAEAELQAKGYRFVDDERLWAQLDEGALQHCLQVVRPAARYPDAKLTSPVKPMRVRVAPAGQADQPLPVPMELGVAADACQFFGQLTDQLDVQKTDGSAARIIRIPEKSRLARDRNGGLVAVAVSTREVSRRRVLVDQHCNLMPKDERDPLEHRIRLPVVFASAHPPQVEMVVEEEVVDVKCTQNSY